MAGADERPGGDLRIRNKRRNFVVALSIGLLGSALTAIFELLQNPFIIFLFVVIVLVAIIGIMDRRALV